ncbi:aspartyl/asparaginyl beta-hydroxylase domain-containing protein [Streptomyces ureilyticus]|uniref:Aspartyl/asparaginyl beta-hydroxylase domain-containing protein n=1 Tax=Streptomyces ureilyticus TaxID=1775131 RepID=A0ABX0DZY9_9ACTN|nr:aspartyl/asparaginyl beta-hydroxylase domain-containing protein [Streptomyces ureilyticus]NGO47515.1 aspartyl/asparaginyl beta-hydroxylase domain-containing protein [Streptomyces ureilyticus]
MKGSLSINQPGVRKALNRYFLKNSGGRNRFRIMSPYSLFPESRKLDHQFDQIKSEVTKLIESRDVRKYGDIDPLRAAEVSTDWRLYYAYMLGETNTDAYRDCPLFVDFAERTPRVVNAIIAILEPGVTLKAHKGPYAGILRYHLPLTVPDNNPPRLRVDREIHTWKEGEGILIDDTFEHEVYNESDGRRIMLIIDIRRPMGLLPDAMNRLSLRAKRKWSAQFIQDSGGDI